LSRRGRSVPPQDLKERIARAAERAGAAAQIFLLETVAEKAEMEERRGEFQVAAERRLSGDKTARPKQRTLAR
jgi:hypothetical protein